MQENPEKTSERVSVTSIHLKFTWYWKQGIVYAEKEFVDPSPQSALFWKIAFKTLKKKWNEDSAEGGGFFPLGKNRGTKLIQNLFLKSTKGRFHCTFVSVKILNKGFKNCTISKNIHFFYFIFIDFRLIIWQKIASRFG